MSVKRLSKAEATDAVRRCLGSAGRIIPSKHFRDELRNEGLDILDAYHVLRTGQVFNEPELDPGTETGITGWRGQSLKDNVWPLSSALRSRTPAS
jgi:hypothetical protein